MAKITEVVSGMTVRVNVGDHQSVDFFTSMKAEGVTDALKDTAAVHAKVAAASLAKLRVHFKTRGKIYTDAQICRMYGIPLPPPKPEFG